MASSFSWLWAYAETGARENFTSHALGLAINNNPAPVPRIFAGLATFRDPETIRSIRAHMQVPVTGAAREGWVDLVVDVQTTDGPRALWVEAKVNAPVEDREITTYRGAIAVSAYPIELIILGGWKAYQDLPHITWDQVHSAIDPSVDGAIWTEFRRYLEEQRMSDVANQPIEPQEADALALSTSLLWKTARVVDRALERAAAELDAEWLRHGTSTGDAYMREKSVRAWLAKGLAEPRAQMFAPKYLSYYSALEFGCFTDLGRVRLEVRLRGGNAKATEVLRDLPGRALLGSHWKWAGEPLLVTSSGLDLDHTVAIEDAVTWLVDRLRELHGAELLKSVDQAGNVTAPGLSTEPPDAEALPA